MANDNLRNLWNTLKSNGYNPPEFDQFVKDMADEANLRKVHSTLQSEGYTPPAFDTFKADMGITAATPATTATEVKTETPATTTQSTNAATATTPPQQQGWRPSATQMAAFNAQVEAGNQRLQQIADEGRQRIQNIQEYNKGSLGFNPGGSVKSASQWNSQSGKFEDTYLTPYGERMTNKAVADFATRQWNEAMDMTVSGQLRRANRELADLRRQLDESATRVHEEWAEDYKKNKAPLAAVLAADTYSPRQTSDPENSALRVAIRQKEEQIKDLQEQLDRDNGVDVGFWRGFGRTVSDFRTWDFGMGDITDAMTMLNADYYSSDKATEGEKRAGQEMMQALYDKQQVEKMYGGNASFWNRAGVMTGYMPSFMIDFAMTGRGFEAVNVFGKAATKGAVKWVGKEAVEEMAKTGFRQYVKKYGARGLGREAMNWTIKSTGTMADELFIRAPLMVNTVQAADVTADAIERKLGDVVIDENGNYNFSNDKTWGSAIWQAEADATIENFS
ncbi:MAG: hypothetical protein NC453_26760, partial [Muribaculum sp.]|nr:hypothetical protein [Muribaculum sp.]